MATNTDRYYLITSFLDVPVSTDELHWLAKAVRSTKQSFSESMDAFELQGASHFSVASENDPYELEQTFFSDFEESRNSFNQWLAVEREINQITGGAERSNPSWPEHSHFLKMVGSNLVYRVSQAEAIFERAHRYLEDATKEVDDYGPENKDDFDDEWFRLQNALDSSREGLRLLEATIPLCWDSLRRFVSSPESRRYIPTNLAAFVEQDDCSGFIAAALLREQNLPEVEQ